MINKIKILIVDDDIAVQTSLSLLLKQAGHQPLKSENPDSARMQLGQERIDLVVLDLNFSRDTSGREGMNFLQEMKRNYPQLPIILITAWGSISLAVEGMKQGAADFITKPWNNEHLLQSIQTTLSLKIDSNDENSARLTRKILDEKYNFGKIIGEAPSFLKVLQTIARVSATDAPVLILGDSGTGKELIAEAIHENSLRRNQPFVKVNLGGISASLFESEMFGHKKGAFTDAKFDRKGRFELAHKGTIFLDEIGDLDLSSQVKLLRVLQDRSFEVLGSSITKTVDIRIICATNRNLTTMVAENEFREDLFYRINLITVEIPSLSERSDDIPLLVQYYINNLKKIYHRPDLSVKRKAMNWLKALAWPGNVRELKNLVERTVLVSAKNVLDVADFDAQLQTAPARESKEYLPPVGAMTLDEMEATMIKKSLYFYEGNISKVAKALGLSRAALYRRMEKYGIQE